jgi:methylmalonyl-CoA mutase cobalamin-binding subunit
MEELRKKIESALQGLEGQGAVSSSQWMESARNLLEWKKAHQPAGLWNLPPLMLTATLDDGLGQGLAVIEAWAQVLGLAVARIGLMAEPEEIVAACAQQKPRILGLTVLRNDMEEALETVACSLPPHTLLVAGGPAFVANPLLAAQAGVDCAAKSAGAFVRFVLERL